MPERPLPTEIEVALVAWRDAVGRLEGASDREREWIAAEELRWREVFHRLAAEHATARVDALQELRAFTGSAGPSFDELRAAAGKDFVIATEREYDPIEDKRSSD